MADHDFSGRGPEPESRRVSLASFSNMAGAVISMALIGGIGTWGYGMIMRDVSGVPVVRALEGPMREAPEEPGGSPAAHQGLSVNRIAADGAAAPPPDQVIIAPQPLDLTSEDVSRPIAPPARDAARSGPREDDVHLAVLRGDDGASEPQDATTEAAEPTEEAASASEPVTEGAADGGLGKSLRPRSRPAGADPVAFAVAAATEPQAEEIAPESLPVGTRLAQLGAYESAEIARTEWDRLYTRLGDLLDGKSRVVQRAESGGRIFYRLRVAGFEDLADARRFCSALLAEKAECIPVVTR